MVKELNLEKLWQVLNLLSQKESELAEQGVYLHLLGSRSDYGEMSFEDFLSHYSFKFESEVIEVFNNDGIPYENFSNEDYSYIPACLLSFGEKGLEKWIDDETERQLSQQKLNNLA